VFVARSALTCALIGRCAFHAQCDTRRHTGVQQFVTSSAPTTPTPMLDTTRKSDAQQRRTWQSRHAFIIMASWNTGGALVADSHFHAGCLFSRRFVLAADHQCVSAAQITHTHTVIHPRHCTSRRAAVAVVGVSTYTGSACLRVRLPRRTPAVVVSVALQVVGIVFLVSDVSE